MRLITLVLRSVTRRQVRTGLTITGMAVAVSSVVALVGVADGFERSFMTLYRGHGVDVVVTRARVADRMTSVLDESLGERIEVLPGVHAVEPVLLDAISFEDIGLYGVVIQGLKPDSELSRDHELIAGHNLASGDARSALLGRLLAENLEKKVGDQVEVYEDELFDVAGIYNRHNIFENSSIIVSLDELQDLMGQPGQVTAFNVTATDTSDPQVVPAVVEGIEKLGGGVSAMATEEYVGTDAKVQGAIAMAWTTSAIALLVGAIGMLNTMTVSVFERTGEIGILRAIGWRRSSIVRMILLESGMISLAAAVLGTLLAMAMTYVLSRLPVSSSIVSGDLAPVVIVQGFAIAMLIGVLGAAYPAYRAANLMPTDTLRHDA